MAIDPLQDSPGYLLRRISTADMSKLGQLLRPLRLRPAEASVLQIIEANGSITQVTIGRMMGIAAPNMVNLTSKLVERGLVERQPLDGRTRDLNLTRSGQRLVRKVAKVVVAHERAFFARIPVAQRSNVVRALRVLWRTM